MRRVFLVSRLKTDNPMVVKQCLYRCDPPLQGNEYVVVSSSRVPFSGPETYAFPGTPEGEIADFGSLECSQRGHLDHELVLAEAGYAVVEEGQA